MRTVLSLLALAFTCQPNRASAAPVTDFVLQLVPALATTADVHALLAGHPAGVQVTEAGRSWQLAFPAIDTQAALRAWGWHDVYAISGDVHQTTFEIRRATGAISANRIASEDPTSGRWAVRVQLVARPPGDLPSLVAGASPAYELPRYPSSFARIEIVPRDTAAVLDALRALATPTVADVQRLLGPPDGDVGSGIYIFEYKLDASTILHVGTADRARVLYLRVGDRDLYRAP